MLQRVEKERLNGFLYNRHTARLHHADLLAYLERAIIHLDRNDNNTQAAL